jgi:hypothetical protein
MSDRPVVSKLFSSRLVLWGVALLAARIVTDLLSRVDIDASIMLFPATIVGTVICLLITQRRAAFLTSPIWFVVYTTTRALVFGDYGGNELARVADAALAYYWVSAVIPVIIFGIGLVSILTSKSDRRNT